MFKKIHSDRDPKDTVMSEIRKEFRPYFTKAGQGLKGAAQRYPKFLFWMMVMNISLSAILCFTVFRHRDIPPKAVPVKMTSPVSGGFDRIMQAGPALRQTIRLKKRVDSITRKKTLSAADSAALFKDLDSLQHIHRTLNF